MLAAPPASGARTIPPIIRHGQFPRPAVSRASCPPSSHRKSQISNRNPPPENPSKARDYGVRVINERAFWKPSEPPWSKSTRMATAQLWRHDSPIRLRNSASSITSTPSDLAFSRLEPASSPATRNVVDLLTVSPDLPPSASIFLFISSRV